MSGLVTRGLTAIVFVVVMIGGLFYSKYSFLILFGLITLLSLWEFYTLTFKNESNDFLRKLYGVFIGITPFLMATFYHIEGDLDPLIFAKAHFLIFLPFIFLLNVFFDK